MEPEPVAQIIGRTLELLPLPPPDADEQGSLQPQIQAALDQSLKAVFPQRRFIVTTSVGGKAKPNLRLLGTSFWPDLEIADGDRLLAAIEVKVVRPGNSPSKAIAEAIGQSLVYSIRYPRVFAFIVNFGHSDDRYHNEDAGIIKQLHQLNIELMLRRP